MKPEKNIPNHNHISCIIYHNLAMLQLIGVRCYCGKLKTILRSKHPCDAGFLRKKSIENYKQLVVMEGSDIKRLV